jgi:PAS domain S-box-containing protein
MAIQSPLSLSEREELENLRQRMGRYEAREEALQASEQAIRELYEITSNSAKLFEPQMRQLLDLGRRRFHLPIAVFTRLRDQHLEIATVQSSVSMKEGTLLPLCDTYCSAAIAAETPVAFEHAGASEWRHHPGYATLGLEAYLGTKLLVQGRPYGTICFMSPTPYPRPFTESDKDFLRLMARWISGEVEREQAVTDLRESEERFRRMFEDAPLGMCLVGPDKKLLKANRRLCEMVGYDESEVVGQTYALYTHPDDLPRNFELTDQFFRGERAAYALDKRYVCKNGEEKWVKVTTTEMVEPAGQARVLLAMVEDITERHLAQKALQESQERLKLAMDGSTDGFWDGHPRPDEPWDSPRTPIWWSPRIREMLGVSAEEFPNVLGSWTSRLHPDDKDRVFGALRAHLDQRVPYDIEYRIQNKQGRYRWVRARGQALWDEVGRPVRMAGTLQCITDRKEAEFALRESQERLALAIDAAKLGFWDWDIRTQQVTWSPMVHRIFGLSDHEFSGRYEDYLGLVHPDDRPLIARRISQALEGTKEYSLEHRIVWSDGSVHWLECKGEVIRDPAGNAVRMVGTVMETTQRKQAEEERAKALQDLENVMETVPDVIYTLDRQARLVGWNKKAETVTGLTSDELMLRPALEFVPEEDKAHIAEAIMRAFEQGYAEAEGRLLTKNGRAIPYHWTGATLKDEQGRVIGLTGVGRDISERKRIEASLRESEERYRMLVDFLPSGVFVYCEGRTAYLNHAGAKILGAASPTEVTDRPTVEFVHPDYRQEVFANAERILAGGDVVRRAERIYLKLDGTPIDVEVEAAPITWKGKPAIQGIFSDISERKRAEEALKKSEERYRALYDDTPSMYFTLATDGTVLSVNRFGAEQLGYRVEDLIGRSVLCVFPEDDKGAVTACLSECLTTPEETRNWEFRKVRKDGRVIWVREMTRVSQAPTGETVVLVTCEDITERKLAEQRLGKINECFLAFGSDPLANLNRLTALCGELLGGTCALYTRLQGELLCSIGRWQAPPDFNQVDRAEGHLCYDLIRRGGDQMVVVRHLGDTSYASTDPNVSRYRLETYVGKVVKCGDEPVGSLCVVFQRDLIPTEADERLMGILASAIGIEEERLRAHEALRVSEERFEIAFRSSPHPVLLTELATGRCLEVNDAALRIFGYRREEVIGQTTIALGLWPALRDREQFFERLREEGPLQDVEITLRAKDGKPRQCRISCAVITLDGQQCLLTVGNDVTEQKRAEGALRESEERFAKAFRSSPYPIVISEIDSGLCLDANDAAIRLFGYRPEEVAGRTADQLGLWPTPEHRKQFIRRLKEAGSVRNVETALRMKSGEFRHCLISAEQIELNGKRCMVTIGYDITEQRRTERDLRFTQFAVERAADMVFWIDQDARLLYVNDAACRHLGYTREEFLRMTVADIDPDYQLAAWPAHWDDLRRQKRLRFETRHRTKAGETYPAEVVANYVSFEGKEYNFAFTRDITQRKRAEEALRASEQELRRAFDERERISQDLHDGILQSLYAVGLQLDAAGRLLGASPRRTKRELDGAISQLNRTIEEVRGFITHLKFDPLEGRNFKQAIQAIVQAFHKFHGRQCRVSVSPAAVSRVTRPQSLHLLSIVREAVSNSVRHGRASEVEVALRTRKGVVRLEVRDNGVGFDPASPPRRGFGLGNMKARSTKIGGQLNILSQPKAGTRVVLELPQEGS